jgi:DNA invertase Pin-like site-specific DNA recombinase
MQGGFAEFESNLRSERQLEGIAKAEAAGIYKGRPPSIEASRVRELKAHSMRPVHIAKRSRSAGRRSIGKHHHAHLRHRAWFLISGWAGTPG